MKKKLLAALALGMMVSGGLSNAHAAPVELIKAGSEWYYKTLTFDLWPKMDAGYDSVKWTPDESWKTGNALFGNTGNYATLWNANTDLALLHNFNLAGPLTGLAQLNVASDNGFIIFLNGQQIANKNEEGSTSYWEYSFDIDASAFETGVNELAVLAEDHGGQTAFDMQLTADVNPVPVPASVLLLGTALAGLAGTRLRRKNPGSCLAERFISEHF